MAISNGELIGWFEQQSSWVQDAVKTFYERGSFTENDVKRFAKECIDEAMGTKKSVDLKNLNLLFRDDRQSFTLKSITDVQGVNALAGGKELCFGTEGVTVVYGENGTGKSGYIRILKKLSDAKYKEDLKKNVYVRSLSKQSCKVGIVSENIERTLECDLSKDGEHSILRDIDIFDTKISNAYIDNANEASYEPWVFTLFRELAQVSTLVKNQIEDNKNGFDAHEIRIPETYMETAVGEALSKVNINTSFDDSFFLWSSKDDEELEKKEKEANVDAISASIVQLENEIKQINGINDYLKKHEAFFSEDNVKKIKEAKETLELAEKEQTVAQLLFAEDATELDKASVSVAAWKALWEDAKDYYECLLSKKGVSRYTEAGGICPLCGQIIGEDHSHRMKTVDEYVNGNVSQKVANERKNYLALLKKCAQVWDQDQLNLALDSCGFSSERKQIEQTASEIHRVCSIINSPEAEKIDIDSIDVSALMRQISGILEKKKSEKQAKEDLLHDDEHTELVKTINEMKAKKLVSSMKDQIEGRIDFLKKAKIHDDAMKLAASNKLTAKSKILSDELLTDDYVKRFNDELRILTKGTVKASLVQQRVSKARIPFRIALEGSLEDKVNPSDVFSEGEKRVVSLAAFFAESSGRNTLCPLIVDDPISSLDLKYESLVIERLVDIGKHRQVIVFTHRLSMVVGLFDRCKNATVAFTEIELRGVGGCKGVPTECAHNASQSLGKLRKLKDQNVAKLKNTDESSPEYEEGIHYVCQQIRICVEKSVEDSLLNGVVLRFRKDVQTQNRIRWLSHITDDDCKLIEEMMTKYSCYDHSMSDELPLQEFSLGEIEDDLKKLIGWLEDIKTRQKPFK